MTPSREEQFRVYLHDRLVGHLHRRDDLTRFVFTSDYWSDPNRPVLGLRFEENPRERHRANMRLPPWFSNLLPEGRLRDWIADAGKISVKREMELLAQVGHDLPGAVRVLPSEQLVPVDLSGDDANRSSPSAVQAGLWSFSLAGVGLKFSMLAQGDRLVVPGVGEGGDWILKMPDSNYPSVPHNELAMMTLADAVGIEVPEVRLLHRDQFAALPDRVWSKEQHAYAVRRFDRGPGRAAIHIEDMAQVRGVYPDGEGNSPGKYSGSFETIGALVYRGHDTSALREFARRLAFNVLIGNGDAHLKNWSLIYHDPRVPTLAPAYDLVATFVYRPPQLGPENMGLRFGRSRRFEDVRLATFDALDKRLAAKADLADVARKLVGCVLDEWPKAASILEKHPDLRSRIQFRVSERAAQLLG
ncbi:MAG: type II toxin-antitoxin system HipA family toxin [Chromatiaceae bacterium]|nr:type II toxin-antitoxin system HipA family toxin [Chromatiaceae bacterium]